MTRNGGNGGNSYMVAILLDIQNKLGKQEQFHNDLDTFIKRVEREVNSIKRQLGLKADRVELTRLYDIINGIEDGLQHLEKENGGTLQENPGDRSN